MRRLFSADVLADDPVAVFHDEDFIADPVGKRSGGGAGRKLDAVWAAIQAGSAARCWMREMAWSFHSMRGLA